MNQEYSESFKLILHAGNSESNSMQAMEHARNYDFEKAETMLAEANVELTEAHRFQTELINNEISNSKIKMNILMVHAQDHLTMATLLHQQASEMLHLYKLIRKLLPWEEIE